MKAWQQYLDQTIPAPKAQAELQEIMGWALNGLARLSMTPSIIVSADDGDGGPACTK